MQVRQAVSARLPLGQRFPAAHQFLRLALADETFPIAPSLSCWAEEQEGGVWSVALAWPALGYAADETFSADELRTVYGRWSSWARACALDIADRLPL